MDQELSPEASGRPDPEADRQPLFSVDRKGAGWFLALALVSAIASMYVLEAPLPFMLLHAAVGFIFFRCATYPYPRGAKRKWYLIAGFIIAFAGFSLKGAYTWPSAESLGFLAGWPQISAYVVGLAASELIFPIQRRAEKRSAAPSTHTG
ncbi:MAG: hypothetical protein WBQ23_05485 [Bacteroidota bacterium]